MHDSSTPLPCIDLPELISSTFRSTTMDQQYKLKRWAKRLLLIRGDHDLTAWDRRIESVAASTINEELVSGIKTLCAELVRRGWDKHRWAELVGVSGMATAFAHLPFRGAQIESLGSSVGVAVWVVLGGGEAMARSIIDAHLLHIAVD